MAKIIATIALVGAILVACAAPASALSIVAHSGATCHNVTGTCLNHGFVCANDEVVPHSQRCDGVEQCADGTDEYMCQHQDDTPIHERTAEARHMAMQGSCVKCNCPASVIDIVKGSAWFEHALVSPTDFLGLMTGTGPYKGLPCEPTCAFTIKMAFYKKTGVCRGWLCCARQRQCVKCNNIGVCSGRRDSERCYV